MRLDRAAIVVIVLLIAAAAAFAQWRRGMGQRVSADAGVVEAAPLRAGQLFSLPTTMTPRLVATWATQVGPYTVCVSSLRPQMDGRRSIPRFSDPRKGSGSYFLVLQITAGDADIARVDLNRDSIRVRDDTGRVYPLNRDIPPGDKPVHFRGGLGYVIPLTAIDPTANVLRSVEGELVTNTGLRRPFRIDNVPFPLPRVSRVFGRMSPRRLSTQVTSRLPDGLVVLLDEAAERAVGTSTPSGGDLSLSSQRLVFTSGVSASIGIPAPSEVDRVVMTASPGQLGRIEVSVEMGDHGWSGKLWDSDVFVLVLPREGSNPRRAAAIRLTRDSFPPTQPGPSTASFVPESGRPGGAILSRTLVGARPFGRGTAEVEIRQWQPDGWSEPRITNCAIDLDGSTCVSNLAPGMYSLRRPPSGLLPDLSGDAPPVALSAYLLGRFGVSSGAWVGERIERVEVRSGRRTVVPPLRFVPSTPVKSR